MVAQQLRSGPAGTFDVGSVAPAIATPNTATHQIRKSARIAALSSAIFI